MLASVPPGGPRRWTRFVPAVESLQGYGLRSFRADLFAGLTVAAVAVPQAMAYALIAGLPVEIGLYTAIVVTFIGAVFDSSKQLINGPTNAIAIASLSVLSPVTTSESLVDGAILLSLMVGCIQLGITALRLGDLTRYISHSVILGFTTGASALLVLDQLKNLLGVPAAGGPHDQFVSRFVQTFTESEGVHAPTALLGVGSIGLVLGLRAVKRRFSLRFLPELLLVVVFSALLLASTQLEGAGVKVVGEVPARLPAFRLPHIDWQLARNMSGGAVAVALLGLLEAVSMAKAISSRTKQRLDINQQLLSEGLANAVGSFFQCMPGSGSLTRSAINQQAGAVSQWSGVVSALAVAATMVLFAPWARFVPRSALAGILILTAFRMVEWRALAYHFRASRFDAVIISATAISAVAISVEFCVLIGVLLSFIMAVPRVGGIRLTEFVVTADGYVQERLDDDNPCSQVLIFGLEGDFFFAAAASLEAQLDCIVARLEPTTRVVILRLKRARNPDAVGLALLDQFLRELHARGVCVVFGGVRSELLLGLERSGTTKLLGSGNLFVEQQVRHTSTHQAVAYSYRLLTKRCAHCPLRSTSGSASSDDGIQSRDSLPVA